MAEYSAEQGAVVQRMEAHAAELPVRRPMPGEDDLMDEFLDSHGNPADWSEQIRLDYAGLVARLRFESLNGGA
ncbi:hypothetical protein ACIQC7_27680 [Kitasatospora sp. NPDC088556]|uniref:hypothetical protein n=1 Tax=Kitasatospora sp. NPDC088556 TaxID=3364076 RepID=UPI0038246A2C